MLAAASWANRQHRGLRSLWAASLSSNAAAELARLSCLRRARVTRLRLLFPALALFGAGYSPPRNKKRSSPRGPPFPRPYHSPTHLLSGHEASSQPLYHRISILIHVHRLRAIHLQNEIDLPPPAIPPNTHITTHLRAPRLTYVTPPLSTSNSEVAQPLAYGIHLHYISPRPTRHVRCHDDALQGSQAPTPSHQE